MKMRLDFRSFAISVLRTILMSFGHLAVFFITSAFMVTLFYLILPDGGFTLFDVLLFALLGPGSIVLIGQGWDISTEACSAYIVVPWLIALGIIWWYSSSGHKYLLYLFVDVAAGFLWGLSAVMVMGLAIT